jgi:hypothetical protein
MTRNKVKMTMKMMIRMTRMVRKTMKMKIWPQKINHNPMMTKKMKVWVRMTTTMMTTMTQDTWT